MLCRDARLTRRRWRCTTSSRSAFVATYTSSWRWVQSATRSATVSACFRRSSAAAPSIGSRYALIVLLYVVATPVALVLFLSASLYVSKRGAYYGRPLSVSGRPCYILPMFFLYFFYGRLILRPWLTDVRENFTRGRPWVSLEKLVLGFFPGHP